MDDKDKGHPNHWNYRLQQAGYKSQKEGEQPCGLREAARAVCLHSVYIVDVGKDAPGQGETGFEVKLHPALEKPTVTFTFTEAEVNAEPDDDKLHAMFVQRAGEAIIKALKGD